MTDRPDGIRQRLELTEHFPDTFNSGNSAADRWREDVTTLLTEIERLQAEVTTWGQIWNDAALLTAQVEALGDGTAQTG